MARSTVVADAVSCSSCGALIRADRPLCLRCGAVLQASAPESKTPRWTFPVALCTCLALGGGAVLFTREVPPTPSVAAAAEATVLEARLAATVPAVPDQPGVNVSPDAASAEATRAGEIAFNAGDLPAALDRFQAAIAANPDDPAAFNNLGQTLVRLERPTEAIQYFDKAVALSPSTWAYHFNRARAYAEMREWAQAASGYREAAALFPDDYATAYNLARALESAGDLPAALDAYQRAISLAPGQADFHLSYGRALEASQRPRDAANAYRSFLELEPGSADAGKVKARIAMLDGVQSNP